MTCGTCSAGSALPDRSALLARAEIPTPTTDPSQLAALRAQDGRPRVVSPSLRALLGGAEAVQPGREREALLIWQSLRARAATGDVAASDDMATLAVLLVQLPTLSPPELGEAIDESSFDAAVMPRHAQELLGRMSRRAAARGDLDAARRYMTWMASHPTELEADIELRIAGAVLATAERDPQRVLALIGSRKDEIPIADALDPMASVFRANALERRGDLDAAAAVLGELPSPAMLEAVRSRFRELDLCARSGPLYLTGQNRAGAARAAATARGYAPVVGAILLAVAAVQLVVAAIIMRPRGWTFPGGGINLIIGAVLAAIGVLAIVRGRIRGRRAAWLWTHGVATTARVAEAALTGTRINNVPVYRLGLQVAGPRGPYRAEIRRLMPEHQVALLLGREVRVRANPDRPNDLVLE